MSKNVPGNGQHMRLTRQWMRNCFKCGGGSFPGQLPYMALAGHAAAIIG